MKKSSLGLKSPRLRDPGEDREVGALVNVEGLDKTGKNHFGCTAPGPIVVISGDRDMRAVRSKFPEKQIEVANLRYDYDPRDMVKRAQHVHDIVKPIWKEAEEIYWDALNSAKVKTIIIDNGGWAWATIRLGKFGKLTQVAPVLYMQVNAVFERMMLSGEKPGKHVIWLHRSVDKWINEKNDKDKYVGVNTGVQVPDGFKHVRFNTQVNLRMGRTAKGGFTAEVINNAFDASFDGMVFTGKMCNYPTIMSSLRGDDPERWS